MELPKIETHSLDLWFANIVDAINYNLSKIESAVPALDKQLTTMDTAPIHDLKVSLDDLVKAVNQAFEQVDNRLRKIELGSK